MGVEAFVGVVVLTGLIEAELGDSVVFVFVLLIVNEVFELGE